MTITLNPEQEQVILDAIRSGLVHSPDEALHQALEALRARLPRKEADDSVAAAARRLGTFGQRHGLSLEGMTVQQLLRESRP